MSEDNFENIETIIEGAPDIAPSANGKAEEKVPSKQADILIRLARAATLFHTPDGDAVADIKIDGHRETHLVRSPGFRKWLRHRFFQVARSGCSNDAMKVAVDTVAAIAQFDGREMPVHIRIAGHEGAIYIDLGDASWRAIKVTALGWKVIDEPPVRFVRSGSTRALPVPESGGSIELLRSFCNLKTQDEFAVLVGHILAIYRPDSPAFRIGCLTRSAGSRPAAVPASASCMRTTTKSCSRVVGRSCSTGSKMSPPAVTWWIAPISSAWKLCPRLGGAPKPNSAPRSPRRRRRYLARCSTVLSPA